MSRKWKSTIVLAVGLFTASLAWGTAQAPDVLLIDGKDEMLNTNPLEAWLASNPGRLPKDGTHSSSNWRGYIATWEVADGKLWLRKVQVEYLVSTEPFKTEDRDVTPMLFPGAKDIVADWYSGTLIVPRGEIVNYVHMGYASTFERYAVITVKQGVVRERKDLDAKQFEQLRRERFKAFQKTEKYKKELAEIKGDMDVKMAIEFMYEFYSEEYLSAE